MKQIKKFNIFVLLVINFLIAAILSIAIINFTPERNVITLSLKVDLANKYTDYFRTRSVVTTIEDPYNFIREFDNKLRSDDRVYDIKNECKQMKRLKKTLPISIIKGEDKIGITITSVDNEKLENCSSFIEKQVQLYNERVRERYRENYKFFDELNKSSDNLLKQENDTIAKLFKKYDTILNKFLRESDANSKPLDQALDLKDIQLIRTYIELNYYLQGQLRFNKNSIAIPNPAEFFTVIESISPIKIKEKSRYIVSPPQLYKIFLSIFLFGLLVFFLIRLVPKKLRFNKIFN